MNSRWSAFKCHYCLNNYQDGSSWVLMNFIVHIGKCLSKAKKQPSCSIKKGVVRSFVKFTGKDLSRSLLFNKVPDPSAKTLLKNRVRHRRFPVNLAKIFESTYFVKHLRRLLLATWLSLSFSRFPLHTLWNFSHFSYAKFTLITEGYLSRTKIREPCNFS